MQTLNVFLMQMVFSSSISSFVLLSSVIVIWINDRMCVNAYACGSQPVRHDPLGIVQRQSSFFFFKLLIFHICISEII